MRTRALVPGIIGICIASFAHAAPIYVSRSAPGPVHDGTSWATAYLSVQKALISPPSNAEIWVAEGVYNSPIALTSGSISLYGGFAGTETARVQRDFRAHPTVLDGQRQGSVVTITAFGVTLDGFTIRNGTGRAVGANVYGGGVYCSNANVRILNNIIAGNETLGTFGKGAGIKCDATTATIEYNIITNNAASYSAGGIHTDGGTLTIANNIISGNGGGTGGGAIAFNNSSVYFVNNTLTGNSVDFAGGLDTYGGTVSIVNNIVAFNSSGIDVAGSSVPVLLNNDVYGNKAFDYNGVTDPTGKNGNIKADPKIANTYRDTHIAPDSPCRDAGDSFTLTTVLLPTDIDGQPRMQPAPDGAVDIGADESDGSVPIPPAVSVIRVAVTGNDANIGVDWAHAKKTVGAALTSARPGDEVWVAAGTYIERVAVGPGVALYGGFAGTETSRDQRNIAVNTCILDGAAAGAVVTARYDGVVVDGFTIRNGSGYSSGSNGTAAVTSGGGIYSSGSTLTASNNNITGNTATYGGGIYCYGLGTFINNMVTNNVATYDGGGMDTYNRSDAIIGPIIILAGNTFSNNTSGGDGGGVFLNNVNYMATGNTLAGNTARLGGGFYLDGSGGVMSGNTISNNFASGDSGGIGCYNRYNLDNTFSNNAVIGNRAGSGAGIIVNSLNKGAIITGNTITGNIALNSAGGLDLANGAPVVSNNTISGNISTDRSSSGGGLYITNTTNALVSNNSILNNTCGSLGGGLYLSNSAPAAMTATLTGNVFAFNHAGATGGAINCNLASINLYNNTVVGNTAPNVGGILCFNNATATVNTTVNLANNIIAFNSAGLAQYNTKATVNATYNDVYSNAAYNYSGLTDPTGTNGNISVSPQLMDPRRGNFHIQPSSPCRNRGDNSKVAAGAVDIDGQGRIQNNIVDIGADESDGTSTTRPPLVLYVKPAGNDQNDGLGWTTALKTVSVAMTGAQPGDEIWVARGNYEERITLQSGVGLYGGFAGTETSRSAADPYANRTVLDAGQGGPVVTADGTVASRAVVDGFTIQNGYTSGNGGGFNMFNGAVVLITRNLIQNNDAALSGGGIYGYTGTYSIADNVFMGNTATNFGGAMDCGAGIYTINNNLVVYNQSSVGGGVGVFAGGSSTLRNNTIAYNSGNPGGYNLSVGTGTASALVNNVIAFNTSGLYQAPTDGSHFRNNDVFGNDAYDYAQVTVDPTGANGNVSADPLFLDPDNGNYRLLGGSPAINAGENTLLAVGELDLDGHKRIEGPSVDLGAYEFVPRIEYQTADFLRALRIAGGLDKATPDDIARLNPNAGNTPIAAIDLAIAIRLLRVSQGLEP